MSLQHGPTSLTGKKKLVVKEALPKDCSNDHSSQGIPLHGAWRWGTPVQHLPAYPGTTVGMQSFWVLCTLHDDARMTKLSSWCRGVRSCRSHGMPNIELQPSHGGGFWCVEHQDGPENRSGLLRMQAFTEDSCSKASLSMLMKICCLWPK